MWSLGVIVIGHIPAFQRPENAGEADFEWTDKYGLALRIKGCFGVGTTSFA